MAKNLELNMDAYLPLRDVVFQTLRTAILKGDLKPGERLMELQLALSLVSAERRSVRQYVCWNRKVWHGQFREKAQK